MVLMFQALLDDESFDFKRVRTWLRSKEGQKWAVANGWRKHTPIHPFLACGKHFCHSVVKHAVLNARAMHGVYRNPDFCMPGDELHKKECRVRPPSRCGCPDKHRGEHLPQCIKTWCKCKWKIDTTFMTDEEIDGANMCRLNIIGRPKGRVAQKLCYSIMMAMPLDRRCCTNEARPHCDQTYIDARKYMMDMKQGCSSVNTTTTIEAAATALINHSLLDDRSEPRFIPNRNFGRK